MRMPMLKRVEHRLANANNNASNHSQMAILDALNAGFEFYVGFKSPWLHLICTRSGFRRNSLPSLGQANLIAQIAVQSGY